MKERPILLNAEMVRAVLNGSKTQTRRIIQSAAKNMQSRGHEVISHRAPGDKWYGDYVYSMRNRSGVWQDFTNEQFLAKCPFGVVGDRLWVREAFAAFDADWCFPGRPHDLKDGPWPNIIYPADGGKEPPKGTCRPSIHMPRWASRITLEITGVRVERLADISEEDAKAEGAPAECCVIGDKHFLGFRSLWRSIYGADSWQANPWVWVIEFKRVEGE